MPCHPGIRPLFTEQPTTDPLLRELVLTPRHSFDVERGRAALDARLAELAVPADGVALGQPGAAVRPRRHRRVRHVRHRRSHRRSSRPTRGSSRWCASRWAMIESEYLQLLQEGSLRGLDRLLASSPTLSSMPVFDLRQYEYDRLADHYVERFGSDAYRLFDFDVLRADPRAYLDGVAEHLGIAPWPALGDDVLRQRFNPTVPRACSAFAVPQPLRAAPAQPRSGGRGRAGLARTAVVARGTLAGPAAAGDRRRPRRRAPRPLPRSNARLAERHGITFTRRLTALTRQSCGQSCRRLASPAPRRRAPGCGRAAPRATPAGCSAGARPRARMPVERAAERVERGSGPAARTPRRSRPPPAACSPAAVRIREKFSPVPISQIAAGNGSGASGVPCSS